MASTEVFSPCKHIAGGHPCAGNSTGEHWLVSIARDCIAIGVNLQSRTVGADEVCITHIWGLLCTRSGLIGSTKDALVSGVCCVISVCILQFRLIQKASAFFFQLSTHKEESGLMFKCFIFIFSLSPGNTYSFHYGKLLVFL